jgi:TDG/mug DNA glycosylase family protein
MTKQPPEQPVADVIAPGLQVLFCGINPGLYSAAVGHHFARPGNRFWKALYGAGFTPRLLSPAEQWDLPALGLGITNLADRPTARAEELTVDELRAGRLLLGRKARRYRPRCVAILGLGAYGKTFGVPRPKIGPAAALTDQTRTWVLPNPSGLNANHQLADLITALRELRESLAAPPP